MLNVATSGTKWSHVTEELHVNVSNMILSYIWTIRWLWICHCL